MKKILLYDIETSPSLGWVWQKYETNVIDFEKEWHILCFAYKWLGESKVHSFALPDFKCKDDKMVVKELWKLFDEADILIGHNCVEKSTPILKTDLTWVKAGELKEGDKLIGFEEEHQPNKARELKESIVIHNEIEERECVEVSFSNGDKIITTTNHPWLKLAPNGREYRWCEAKNLIIGQRVEKFFVPWEKDKSYEAGWLSGFISGEGTLKKKNESKKMGGLGVDFYQRPGTTWEQALDYCEKLKMPVSKSRTVRASGIGRQDTLCTGFLGGKLKILEIIGKLQIKRFIEKIDFNNIGGLRGKDSTTQTIIGINSIGKKKVAVLGTTTKTYIADGYPMHNSRKFDDKKVTARFIYHKLSPPSPYKSVDTLQAIKRVASFNSHKLDDLGKLLGEGKKIKTDFGLWLGCMNNDEKAWDKMVRYNKQDVKLLERIYLRILPYIKSHPNLSSDEAICPRCGSNEINFRGYASTLTNKYRRFVCKKCGGWSRINQKENLPKKKMQVLIN